MNRNVVIEIIDNVNIFIGFLSLLITLSHALIKKKQYLNYLIMTLYGSYGIIMIAFYFESTGRIADYTFLYGISWPFHLIGTAAFYLYVKKIVNPLLKPERKHLLYFLPSLVFIILLFPFIYLQNPEEKLKLILEYNSWKSYSLLFLFLYSITVKLILFTMGFFELRIFWNREKFISSKVFRIVFLLIITGLAAVALNYVGLFARNILLIRIDTMLFHVVVIVPFFLGFRYPTFMHELSVEISREKYKNSKINGINVDSVLMRLKELFEIEKIFKDPELNISGVSKKLEISTHQLSEILNDKLHINYNSFVHNHRIQEAKKILLEHPEYSILETAYNVGYNTKVSFNTSFKKITGLTPTEFKKKHMI